MRTSSFLKSVGFTTTRTPFLSVHSVTPISGMLFVATTWPGAGFSAMSGTFGGASSHGLMSRAKTDIVRQYEQSVKERDASDGKQFAREIVRLFLQDEA